MKNVSYFCAFTLIAALAVSVHETSAQVADVWSEIAALDSGDNAGGDSLAAPPNFTCECPLQQSTVDNCPVCTTDGPCRRAGCAYVYRVGEVPHVDSKVCVFAEEKACKCDGTAFTPPLPPGHTTYCEKTNSNQCANRKCIVKNTATGNTQRTQFDCGT